MMWTWDTVWGWHARVQCVEYVQWHLTRVCLYTICIYIHVTIRYYVSVLYHQIFKILALVTSIIYIYMIYNYQILSTTWPVPPYQANVSWAPRPQATGMMYGFPYQHWPKSRLWVVGWIEGWSLYLIIKALGHTSCFLLFGDLAFLWWTIIKEPQGYTCCKDGPQAKQPRPGLSFWRRSDGLGNETESFPTHHRHHRCFPGNLVIIQRVPWWDTVSSPSSRESWKWMKVQLIFCRKHGDRLARTSSGKGLKWLRLPVNCQFEVLQLDWRCCLAD